MCLLAVEASIDHVSKLELGDNRTGVQKSQRSDAIGYLFRTRSRVEFSKRTGNYNLPSGYIASAIHHVTYRPYHWQSFLQVLYLQQQNLYTADLFMKTKIETFGQTYHKLLSHSFQSCIQKYSIVNRKVYANL